MEGDEIVLVEGAVVQNRGAMGNIKMGKDNPATVGRLSRAWRQEHGAYLPQ